MKRRVMLYFGSFNPVHCGHTGLAEYAVEHDLCDEVVLVVSPQNPLKDPATQAPEMARFEMAELACAASRYPDRIKASAVEFLLERPSYTIHTLRYLTENHGDTMTFSILMGADLIAQFDRWMNYEEILADYPIYVYPRDGYPERPYAGRVTYLEGVPTFPVSSTHIREALVAGKRLPESILRREVAEYIGKERLWCAERTLPVREAGPHFSALLASGKEHYRRNEWGAALNDFNRALAADPTPDEAAEARQWIAMTEEILAFRYTDLYNP